MDWDALAVEKIEQLIMKFKEAIERAGGGMMEVEFTGVEAGRIVGDLQELLRLKSESITPK